MEPEVSAGIIDKLVQKQVKKDNVQPTSVGGGRRCQHQNILDENSWDILDESC